MRANDDGSGTIIAYNAPAVNHILTGGLANDILTGGPVASAQDVVTLAGVTDATLEQLTS